MTPNNSLDIQATKIEQYRTSTRPTTKHLSGMDLIVLPHVFPGGTDTGLLCDTIRINKGEITLDLCTGTGAVAIKSALLGAAEVWGTDISADCVRNAEQNQAKFGIKNAKFIVADVFPPAGPTFDVITINPPYTDTEAPDLTAKCFWDKDNQVVKTFFANLATYLKPTGRAYMSWASFANPDLLPGLAATHHFTLRQAGHIASEKSGFAYYVYEIKPQL
ncbi:MAG: methyltransferase [Patescibacteria group bacterium]|nr:methyltransferase [Patescibacteria group bacterium]